MSRQRNITYVDAIVAFDIETTSYKDDGEKKAITYTWTLSVDGEVTVHRTADEFIWHLNDLSREFELDEDRRLVVYVHNLAYEFAFIKQYFHFTDVFAIGDVHRVTRATTDSGIEFRCSYMLTHLALSSLGKEVGVAKMEGDLDYSLMRHGETALTDEEMGYIHNDVLILDAFIRGRVSNPRMGHQDTLKTLPMTSTGYVRRNVRAHCRKDDEYTTWLRQTPLTVESYQYARQAFSGGYVHANAALAGKVLTDVDATDLGSSYPSSMAQFRYPMGTFMDVPVSSREELERICAASPAFIDVTLEGIISKTPFPPISASKTLASHNVTEDNGRVYAAESARVIITDVDWGVIQRSYEITSARFHRVQIAPGDVMPDAVIAPVLELYRKKTELKNVAGMEDEYGAAKADINGVYGMAAMDPHRDNIFFDEATQEVRMAPADLADSIESHNASRSRFLYYPWAAWITAYSRAVLQHTIMDLLDAGVEVVYCDTDSIYYLSNSAADEIIEKANQKITARIEISERKRGHTGRTAPKTPKGDSKPLGVFEFDGSYAEFKTLGAKRYATRTHDGEFHITVSGLSKKAASWVEEQGGMEFFKDGMTVPKGVSGRMTHTYSDATVRNQMVDYQGNVSEVTQRGFVHLEETEYHLGISDAYSAFMEKLTTNPSLTRAS